MGAQNPEYPSTQGTVDRSYAKAAGHFDKTIERMWILKDGFAGNLTELFDKIDGKGDEFKMRYVTSHVSQPKEVAGDLGSVPKVVPIPGRPVTFTRVMYKQEIELTRDAFEEQRHDTLMAQMEGLTRSGQEKDERLRASIINNGFTGTDGDDSLPLFYDSHPHELLANGTWDNLTTGPLTGSNLQAAWLLMDLITNPNGDPMKIEAQQLWVHPNNRRKAKELIGSSLRAEDGLNAKTVIINDLELKVSKYFTTTTQYTLAGNLTGEEKGIHEIVFSDWNMADNTDRNVDILISKRIRGKKAFGFSHSKNLVSAVGT